MSKSRARRFADIISGAEQVPVDALDNASPTALSDKDNSSTGAYTLPSGNTAQRPTTAYAGGTRLNNDTGSLEVYDGSAWNAVTRPFIANVSGVIYPNFESSITVTGTNFTPVVTAKFYKNNVYEAEVTSIDASSGSVSITVPSTVYGSVSAGEIVEVSIFNTDGTSSNNTGAFSVQGLPSGGVVSQYNGYVYHKFTGSGSLSVPAGFSRTAQVLIIGGGAGGSNGDGGNDAGGGGGAGGVVYNTNVGLSNGTYSAIVGAGGAGLSGSFRIRGNGGNNSSFTSVTTAIGGGYAGRCNEAGGSGGSGGGAGGGGGGPFGGGAGTSGQGNSGGTNSGSPAYTGAGGGGYVSSGGNSGSGLSGGNGGAGTNVFSEWATATNSGVSGYFAGGGAGGGGIGSGATSRQGGTGGAGGGGRGGNYNDSGSTGYGGNAPANSGSGGGGAGNWNANSGSGGSGIVIVRYQI